jgi:MtN3 and saliva related transmembrane protein
MDLSSPLVRTIGFIAGVLTTLAFVPQVIKSWRTRSAGDFSLTMLVAFTSGVGLWLTYGILLREPPIILANAVTLLLAVMLLWMKLKGRSS